MRYVINVRTNTGSNYKFICNEQVTNKFKDFVNGLHSEQFFTIYAGKNFVMLSRRSIEYVSFEEEKNGEV